MNTLVFAKRDKEVGYYGRQLWLPKKHINSRSIKAGLEFPVLGTDGLEFLQLWEDSADHIIVPREFIHPGDYEHLDFPVYNTCPPRYDQVHFRSNVTLDLKDPTKDIQLRAYESMIHSHGEFWEF